MIDGQVERHRAAVRVLPDPGPGEDRLDQHGARQDVREDEPDHGHHRGQRGTEDVPDEHVPLGQPLRAGGRT